MRKSILLTTLTVLLHLPVMTDGATISDGVVVAPSAVTVFEDRARVHRSIPVEMPIGSKEVILKGLPHRLDPSSVRLDCWISLDWYLAFAWSGRCTWKISRKRSRT